MSCAAHTDVLLSMLHAAWLRSLPHQVQQLQICQCANGRRRHPDCVAECKRYAKVQHHARVAVDTVAYEAAKLTAASEAAELTPSGAAAPDLSR